MYNSFKSANENPSDFLTKSGISSLGNSLNLKYSSRVLSQGRGTSIFKSSLLGLKNVSGILSVLLVVAITTWCSILDLPSRKSNNSTSASSYWSRSSIIVIIGVPGWIFLKLWVTNSI